MAPIINPKIGLITAAVINAFFGLLSIMMPMKLLEAYKLYFAQIEPTDKFLIGAICQTNGVMMLICAATLSITARNGTDAQKSNISLMNAVGSAVFLITSFSSTSYWVDLGAAPGGMYFNVCLYGLVAVLNFMGSNYPPAFKVAPLKNPIYWGFLVWIPIFLLYAVMSAFATDSLVEGYGMKLSGDAKLFFTGSIKYVLSVLELQIALLFTGLLITPGSNATYTLGRFLSAISVGMFLTSAIWAMIYTCLNVDGKYDKVISGQNFNMGLWGVFFLLFYVPMARMDHDLAPSIRAAVEGTNYKDAPADESSDEGSGDA